MNEEITYSWICSFCGRPDKECIADVNKCFRWSNVKNELNLEKDLNILENIEKDFEKS